MEATGVFRAMSRAWPSVIGHADRVGPLRDYCTGLMLPCERKSVEPMAAVTAPARTAAQHQSLLHFVGQASWSDEQVLAKVCEMVLPAMERHGPIEAWIIDDTGFPKKGKHSVGRGAAVLRTAGQAGQLPGGGLAVDRQPPCEPAGALSALSAAGMGGRRCAPAQGSRARGDRLQDQAGDRARPDALGLRGGPAARRGAAGCGLWQSHQPAHARSAPWG